MINCGRRMIGICRRERKKYFPNGCTWRHNMQAFFGIWWWMGITSFKRLPDPISPKRLDVSRVTECSCNKSQLPISKIITNIYNLVCMSILSFMTVLDAYGLSNYYNFWWYSELVQIGNTKENMFVILPGNQCRLRFTLIM